MLPDVQRARDEIIFYEAAIVTLCIMDSSNYTRFHEWCYSTTQTGMLPSHVSK